MGLTGIQIFKMLPKTNCGECGVPTCLAFAMNLASGKAELDACPYVSDEAKAQLAEYQQKLASAGEEIQGMLEEARRDAEKVGEKVVAKARGDAEAEHQRALAEIESATSAAIEELAERSADLAVDLAGKIVRARLDRAAHARLIEEAVSNFAKTKATTN